MADTVIDGLDRALDAMLPFLHRHLLDAPATGVTSTDSQPAAAA